MPTQCQYAFSDERLMRRAGERMRARTIGHEIRRIRIDNGITRDELALHLGTHHIDVLAWERELMVPCGVAVAKLVLLASDGGEALLRELRAH